MKPQSCRFDASIPFSDWQTNARRELTDLLGITELMNAERCALAPRSLWKRNIGPGTVEKNVFQSDPGVENNSISVCLTTSHRPITRSSAFRGTPLECTHPSRSTGMTKPRR